MGLNFSACHFLTEHEKCGRLHGHNYGVHLHVEGDVAENGILFDFVTLKAAMREVVAELDHKVLLPGNSRVVELVIGETNIIARHGNKEYSFPLGDVAVLDLNAISAEMLATFILERLLVIINFPPNVHKIEVGVDEGVGQGARVCREL